MNGIFPQPVGHGKEKTTGHEAIGGQSENR